MRISHKNKFIFFSFPKTGSESVRLILDPFSDVRVVTYVERSLDNPFYSHMTPLEVLAVFEAKGWDFYSYSRILVVRNPWARLVSMYEMIYRNPLKKYYRPSFKKWLFSIDNKELGGGGKDSEKWKRYGTYSVDNFSSDFCGNRLVSDIIKLEEMQDKFPQLLARLNLPGLEDVKLPHINKTPLRKANYRSYYDDQAIDYVGRLYRNEIIEFNYSFF
jgi:hypothetical protein